MSACARSIPVTPSSLAHCTFEIQSKQMDEFMTLLKTHIEASLGMQQEILEILREIRDGTKSEEVVSGFGVFYR